MLHVGTDEAQNILESGRQQVCRRVWARASAAAEDETSYACGKRASCVDFGSIADVEDLVRRQIPETAGAQEPARIRFEYVDIGISGAQDRREERRDVERRQLRLTGIIR